MRRALTASLLAHTGLVAAMLIGLPQAERLPIDEPIAVEIVSAPDAKATPAPPKPAPAATAPTPPRQAAAPEPPKPAPEPPKVAEAKPEPPPPRPEPPVPPPPKPEPVKPPEPVKAAEAKPEPAPPPPKPEPPKPEPPKVAEKPPEPPKVEPPKQVAQKPPEPKPPAKPPEPKPTLQPPKAEAKPDPFEALLRSVETQARREKAPDKREGTGKMIAPDPAQLDSRQQGQVQLSASEIGGIKRQIEACWSVPVGVRDLASMQVTLRILMNPDGTVQNVEIQDRGRLGSDFGFRTVAESAQRAVLRCKLTLAPEKYTLWRDMIMTFYPGDALSG